MNEYTPDGWCIIKHVTEEETNYFVFASWSGGYLHGDSWKRNSGITKVENEDEYYLFHGYTGSIYRCAKALEGRISSYNSAVLQQMCDLSGGTVIRVEEIELPQS